MNKIHYTISEAAKQLHVESHVLRYWEDELHLNIPRNKMGHRTYGEKELDSFRQIMKWKEEGLSLKDIQSQVIQPSPKESGQVIPYPTVTPVPEDDKMTQFKKILGRIVAEAIRDNSDELTTDIASHVADHVNKELDFLFREKEEADEKRFRELDETIRSFQRARQEAAATEVPANKSKNRHRFGKK